MTNWTFSDVSLHGDLLDAQDTQVIQAHYRHHMWKHEHQRKYLCTLNESFYSGCRSLHICLHLHLSRPRSWFVMILEFQQQPIHIVYSWQLSSLPKFICILKGLKVNCPSFSKSRSVKAVNINHIWDRNRHKCPDAIPSHCSSSLTTLHSSLSRWTDAQWANVQQQIPFLRCMDEGTIKYNTSFLFWVSSFTTSLWRSHTLNLISVVCTWNETNGFCVCVSMPTRKTQRRPR